MAGREAPTPARAGVAKDGLAAGGYSHDREECNISAARSQAADSGGLDYAALAAAHVVMPLSDNGEGPPDDPAPAARFPLLSANELKDFPPVAWLVKNEIPKHGLSLIYGPTGGGKSFVTLDYAFRIAQTSPVVYVAGEGAAGYAARVLAWTKHHAQEPGQLYFVGQAVNLLDPDEVTAFIAAISELSPALVIVDTLARCMIGGDENAARDMGQAVAGADRIKRAIGQSKMGGAVILVHHSTKAGNTERGSGALKAACDQVIRLDNDDGLLTLSCEKAKDATPFDPRALRLLPVETGRQTEDDEPETSCAVIPSDKMIMRGTVTASAQKVLETLAMETFKEPGGRASVLIHVTGLKDATFYRAASALVRDGFVRQSDKGDPYFLTEKGVEKLSQLS